MNGKRYRIVLYLVFLLVAPAGAGEIIKNSKHPPGLHGKTRTVDLTEVMRISDDDGGFLFTAPRRIKITPDGSVFVAEFEKLFKFSPEGKFSKNLLVIGEGPGEVKRFADFMFDGSEIIIGGYTPVKLIFIDAEAHLKDEVRINDLKPLTLFCHAFRGRYYFRDLNLSFETLGKLNAGIILQTHTFYTVDRTGKVSPTGLEFKTRSAMVKGNNEGRIAIGISEITRLLTAFDADRFLYVSHTDRYRITQVDLKTGKIIRHFSRVYDPVPFEPKPPEGGEFNAEIEKIKNQKFYNDIQALQINGGRLMVFTSTLNERKQVMVDVFDDSGRYRDCFFLNIPNINRPDDLDEKPLCFHRGFFWSVELDEDDVPAVVQYRISMPE